MGVNLYSQQTLPASEKFAGGETTAGVVASILIYMEQTKFYFAQWALRAGKRQHHVVKGAELTPGYVSQLWSGKYKKEPTHDTLARIARVLGVPTWVLRYHPTDPEVRGAVAISKIPKDKQETAVQMLEGLADRDKL